MLSDFEKNMEIDFHELKKFALCIFTRVFAYSLKFEEFNFEEIWLKIIFTRSFLLYPSISKFKRWKEKGTCDFSSWTEDKCQQIKASS